MVVVIAPPVIPALLIPRGLHIRNTHLLVEKKALKRKGALPGGAGRPFSMGAILLVIPPQIATRTRKAEMLPKSVKARTRMVKPHQIEKVLSRDTIISFQDTGFQWCPSTTRCISLQRPFRTEQEHILLYCDDQNDVLAAIFLDNGWHKFCGVDRVAFVWKCHDDIEMAIPVLSTEDNADIIHGSVSIHGPIEDFLIFCRETQDKRDIPISGDMRITTDMATRLVFRRYLEVLSTPDVAFKESGIPNMGKDHLIWMCRHMLESAYPIDKMNRWLGWVQGAMAISGLLDSNTERDVTRPLFTQAYRTEYQG